MPVVITMKMMSDRLLSCEAADILGLSKTGFAALARRRDWETDEDGKNYTYARADIEQEIDDRLKRKQFRITPAVRAHAERCAETIRQYWQERGYKVQVEANRADIVSDLVNGLPRR